MVFKKICLGFSEPKNLKEKEISGYLLPENISLNKIYYFRKLKIKPLLNT